MSEFRIKRIAVGMKANSDWVKLVVDGIVSGNYAASDRREVLKEIREGLEIQREAAANLIHLTTPANEQEDE